MKKYLKIYLIILISTFNVYSEDNKLSLSKFEVIGNKINFRIQTPERCMFGDFDALKLAMMYSSGARLKLSTLILNGKEEKVVPFLDEITFPKSKEELKTIQEALISSDYLISIPMPRVNKKIGLIKICKSKTESCSSSIISDLNDVIKKYQQPVKNLVSDDNVYFYQPIIISKKEILFFSETIHEKNIEQAKILLKKLNIDISKNDVNKILNEVAVLKSMPLINQEGALLISLPVYSPKKCSK